MITTEFRSVLLAGICTAVLPAAAYAETAPQSVSHDEDTAAIVVTGSRTIRNGNDSPTPLTVVSMEQLQTSAPSNVPDALNKLPVFATSRGQSTINNASTNASGNFLNLRGFGVIRTLILFDGKRVAPTAADGTVNVDTLPQMLMKRVDVVTGGASAVYGSDAITGVVNFVLDRKFKGLRADIQSGISQRGDGKSFKAGVAAGTDLLDGRGHFEASFEHFRKDGLSHFSRDFSSSVYGTVGAGTDANPYHLASNVRDATTTIGGLIRSGIYNNFTFDQNGVLTPLVRGTASGTNNLDLGGGGGYNYASSLTASLATDQAFGRFSYDLAPDTTFYVQGSFTRAQNKSNFAPFFFRSRPVAASNAFLPASVSAAMLAAGQTSFNYSIWNPNYDPIKTDATTKSYTVEAGFEGTFANFSWNVFYNRGHSSAFVQNINNIDNARMDAALDAVLSNGQVVCRVSVTNPGLYPGCVPINLFGPTAASAAAVAYVRPTTSFRLVNTQDDFGGSISGDLFSLPAGGVTAALSGEYRHVALTNSSNAQPTDTVNCTGLPYTCPAGQSRYVSNIVADMKASQNIGEVAGEVTIPVLKDAPLAQSFSVNGAFRYTHYSVSGSATTWKVGLDWKVTDDLSLRATRSRDMRAPTLLDMFGPVSISPVNFSDPVSNSTGGVNLQSQGNANLVPEVSNTKTIGFVYKPAWFPGFSMSVDYFDITINNAITSVSGNSASNAALCQASSGSSPLCSLFVRPSASAFPTLLYAQAVNVAKSATHGVDAELNYVRPLGGGQIALRGLLTYQPSMTSQQTPASPVLNDAGVATWAGSLGVPKWRITANVNYTQGGFSLNVQERWRSRLKQNDNPAIIFSDPPIAAVAYTDLTVSQKIAAGGHEAELFLTVENLLDKSPPIFGGPSASGAPALFAPVVPGDDIMGRYFSAGIRFKL